MNFFCFYICPKKSMQLPFIEPYKIKMVEPIYTSTKEQRLHWIKEAKYNLFNLKSNQVIIDLLTDSGTGAMSDSQWAEIMLGDESYAGASSYFKLKDTISFIFGMPHFLPTHQGRAAENVLFSVLVKKGDIIPGNSHFDTTKGHIEFRNATAIDCTIQEAFDIDSNHPFKGNVDIDKLENVLKEHNERIPFIILTLTCNSSGGQPISIENIREVRRLADKYKKLLIFDSARFAENAYFIKTREPEFANKTIAQIVREMFSYADIMTMSSKKDGIVNIGGFIGFKNEEIFKQASVFNIMFEGYITYGGMAGRDMNALSQGLKEVIDIEYLKARISQIQHLGKILTQNGIPIQKPFGGHAIFVDANGILEHIPVEQYRAQVLATEIYVEGGVRGVEIGTLLADRDPITKKDRYPKNEFVRLAIPRRVYTISHIEYIAATLINVYERRKDIKTGFRIAYEAPIMRHFTVELEKI